MIWSSSATTRLVNLDAPPSTGMTSERLEKESSTALEDDAATDKWPTQHSIIWQHIGTQETPELRLLAQLGTPNKVQIAKKNNI